MFDWNFFQERATDVNYEWAGENRRGNKHGNFTSTNIRIPSIELTGSNKNSVTCKTKRNDRLLYHRETRNVLQEKKLEVKQRREIKRK